MMDKEQDPNLKAPQEANTTKHINFREAEESNAAISDSSADDTSKDESLTKKAWQELRDEHKSEAAAGE